jgi:hypothetical protein
MEKANLKPLSYPPKILIAWAEAIGGNKDIRDWLMDNGYKELAMFTFAVRNKDEARKWLMENGYAHLMAMINAVERNQVALKWLQHFNFTVLEKMALSGDGDDEAHQWLIANGHREFAYVAKKIQYIKDQIEDNNNDPHRISPD